MKKTIFSFAIIFYSALVFCSCSNNDAAGLSKQEASHSKQETTVETLKPAPSATAAPKQAPASKEAPTPEPTPVPYTDQWLERYAPASVLSYEEQVGKGSTDTVDEYPPVGTYRLTVDYNNQCVWAYSKDDNGDYTVLERVMLCTTGGNGNWTPEGVYEMGEDRIRFGEFETLGGFAQYWSQIEGSFYFHSVLYNERDVSTLVKSSYDDLGTPVSHGCVRLFVPDAEWIYTHCAPGTVCEITTEPEEDKALKAALKKGYDAAVDITKPSN